MPSSAEASRGAVPPAGRAAAPSRSLGRLLTQTETLSALAAEPDAALTARAEAVSRWTVGQQLEHMGRAGLWVADAVSRLAERPEAPPAGRPSLPGWVHLATGWIPRGRVRAAHAITPRSADPEAARRMVARYRRGIAGLAALPSAASAFATVRGTRPHPVLGHLNARRWLRFLFHHQRHHLAIVEDIRRAIRSDTGTGREGAA